MSLASDRPVTKTGSGIRNALRRRRRANHVRLEWLEDRTLMASLVYINGAWSVLPVDTTVFVGPNAYTIGTNAFGTVQAGVDATDPGGVANVLAGTYDEAVRIDHPITLDGAGEGTTTLSQGLTLTAQPDGNHRLIVSNLSVLAAKDSNADGFLSTMSTSYGVRIDATSGDTAPITLQNTLIRSPQVQLVSGVNVVYGAGIIVVPNGHTIDDVVLNTVTADHNYSHGMYVIDAPAYTTGTLSHLSITESSFDTNNAKGLISSPGQYGYGFYTTAPKPPNSSSPTLVVDHVTVSNSSFSNNPLKGIYVETLSNSTFTNITVQNNGNTVTAGPAGIDINLKYGAYQNLAIQDSTISNNGNANTLTGSGLTIKARNDAPNYNTITASLSGVTLTNTSISGSPFNLTLANNVALSTVALSGVTLSGPATASGGVGLFVNGETSGQSLDLGDTSFASTLDSYIASTSNVIVHAEQSSFDGVVGSNLTNNEAYAASAKNLDALDVGGAGAVYLRPNQRFVVPGAGDLQRGIDAAMTGDRIHIAAGTYTENLSINKAVALEGELGTILNVASGGGITITNPTGLVDLKQLQVAHSPGTIAAIGINTTTGGTLRLDTVSISGFTSSLYFTGTGGTGAMDVTGPLVVDVPLFIQSGILEGVSSIVGGVSVNTGATIVPGPLPGVLQIDTANLGGASTLQFPIAGELVGTGYGQLAVTNSVDLTGVYLSLQVDPSFTPSDGSEFVLIRGSASNTISGKFQGLPEGSIVPIGGKNAILSYIGGPGGHNVTLTVPGAAPPYIDPGGTDVGFQTQIVGGSLQLLRNGVVVDSRPLSSVTSLTIDASAVANSLFVLDVSQIGLMGLSGNIHFIANPSGNNSVEIDGTGTSTGIYRPDSTTTGDGDFIITNAGQTLDLSFSGLRPTLVHGMSSFVIQTNGANGHDVVNVQSTLSGLIDSYLVTGTSSGVAFESVTFYDIATFTIDTGFNDLGAPNPDDLVTIGPMGGPVAQGLSNLIVTTGLGADLLTVDFSNGNPIPQGANSGLTYTGTSGLGTLDLIGGSFVTEVNNANGPGSGAVSFTDAASHLTAIQYGGIAPINDSTVATNYIFNDNASPDGSFSVTNSTFGPLSTLLIGSETSPTSFESANIANKTNVVINTNTTTAVNGVVNLATAPTGLSSLRFNTATAGDNLVQFIHTPLGVATSLVGGSDSDTTNVVGTGVPLGTTLSLNGALGSNTLNLDAGGLTPAIIAGILPGEVIISLPGFGSVSALNYAQIQILNAAVASAPAVTPVDPLNSIEGFQLVDAEVGTFTFSLSGLFPAGTVLPAGLPASSFTATYAWGDGAHSAPTITQDAGNPSVYHVTATHTYADPGLFLTGLTVSFVGGPVTGVLNGVPVTLNLNPVTVAPTGPTTALVTNGILAVTAYPIVGTEGQTIAAGPIATFIDAGGADLMGAYSASIRITNSTGFSLILPAAGITQVGSSDQFTVNAPAITLPEEGTYQIQVTVTDAGQIIPIVSSGASAAVIADAALTPGAVTLQNGATGASFLGVLIGSFTDGNIGLGATPADFTAVVDWGDGSPTTTASFSKTGPGTFDVTGNHVFAKPGTYLVRTIVTDVGGATTTLTASFSISDLPVSGTTRSFTAVEGQDTGSFTLATFEDPNPLATIADVHAELAVGGWGDGTPGLAGVTLAVQQIGSNPATGNPIFQVLGSHKYADETPPGLPFSLSVIITTLGGVSTTLTSPPGGGVTVLDATLTSRNATTIAGVEGITTGTVLIGSFSDANQGATVADFTAGGGSVVVNWGDNSLPETLGPGNLVATGSPNGVIFTINAAHTFTETGTYPVTITVTDDGGATASISSAAVIADAPISLASFSTIGVTEGTLVSNFNLISFVDANPSGTTTDFTASIDWGDGSPSSVGTVTQLGGPGSPFQVLGSHNYIEEGAFTITVTVIDVDGAHPLVATTGASITDALLIPSPGLTIASTEGQPLNNVAVGAFTDTNPFGAASDFTASINWGDGSTTLGAVQLIGGNATGAIFEVLGSHTYTDAVNHPITITVTDKGGAAPITITSTAVVSESPISLSALPVVGVEGIALAPTPVVNNPGGLVLVATFQDSAGLDSIGSYTATVNWGDSSSDTTPPGFVQIVSNGAGIYSIFAPAHIYQEAGNYNTTVSVTDTDGLPLTVSAVGIAVISDAALTSVQSPTLTATEGQPLTNAIVATFNDANPTATAADFSAVIFWGDGSSTLGVVSQTGGPGTSFVVRGTHTFADETAVGNPIPVSVTITDKEGASANTSLVPTLVTVNDASLTAAAGIPVRAVEGLGFIDIPVATFTDTNRSGTVADFTATINWGDGGPTSVGVIRMVGGTAAGTVFQVLGTHTYATFGTFPITLQIADIGGANATINTMIGNNATGTVVDAPLSSQGATVKGVEGLGLTINGGTTFGPVLIGTFTDIDPTATVADFTTLPGSVKVDWGDGTALETLNASNLTALGSILGVVFSISAGHVYGETGTYQVTITVTDQGGSTTVIHGVAAIADAPLSPIVAQPPVNVTESVAFTLPVVAFSDANPMATISDYKATIDWGDGTPTSFGTIIQPGGVGTPFYVVGSHTYATSLVNSGSGLFAINAQILDVEGASTTVVNVAQVADRVLTISGALNPSSDTGQSAFDGITKNSQPTYFGTTSEAFASVYLYAQLTSGGPITLIGQGMSDGSRGWTITSTTTLADGIYSVNAVAVDRSGETTSTFTLMASGTAEGPLVVDTAGPKVTNVSLDRKNGQIDLTFQDNLSGLNPSTVASATNYTLTKQHTPKGTYLVNVIMASMGGPTAPENVVLTLRNGSPLRGGHYTLTIHDSILDVAGNELDGEFYGFFPSGNNVPGHNFVANIDSIHNLVSAPKTVVGRATPVSPPGSLPKKTKIPTFIPQKVHAFPLQIRKAASHNVHDAALPHIHVKSAAKKSS